MTPPVVPPPIYIPPPFEGVDAAPAAAPTLPGKVPLVFEDDAARAAALWLRARAHERLGSAEEAAEALDRAHALAPAWVPVLEDLAYYASDRGDLAGAWDLAQRAGMAADEPLMAILRRMRTVPVRDLGRNQPCWCGSGRKYKACHLGREQVPLSERALWLYDKARIHQDRGSGRQVILPLA